MPFTLSHSVLALPFFKNKKISATALFVGAMSPDLEYFFRMRMQSEISHTLPGVFLIDFPLGLIVMFAFHQIIKKPLIDNLPAFFQKRLQELRQSNWLDYFKNNVATVLLSFFIGTLSHIFWDSMTHWDGLIVQQFSFFNLEIYTIPVYKIAQHLSSIIGLLGLVLYLYQQPEETVNVQKINSSYWLVAILLSVVFLIMRFYFGTELNKIGNAIVSIISPIVMATVVTGIIFKDKTAT
ncbi:DUF4184 family protein [Flavobacterium muglaense]|uniref:DUF4184 family protein n=1 Tax=Flavobacterium muglaense TaxID=2764716 RepID=A0A923N0I7_9FLAO|nr:DUF4184 family protein [Flavobacterium muglaense]MBC5836959.1 DUF4184 family protein [Flavobacterium muglaense]MBC5843488.1 DUF4184 family protein [Flavobacterium muglaense]